MLPQQAHGTKTCTGKGSEYNDQCTFTCDVGYERKGSSVRTCQADGQWSGTQATCEGTFEIVLRSFAHYRVMLSGYETSQMISSHIIYNNHSSFLALYSSCKGVKIEKFGILLNPTVVSQI